MTRAALVVVLVALASSLPCALGKVGGDLYVPSEYDCSVYAGCAECVADMNCGWCAVENTCVEGNGRRPRNTTAPCTAYEYAFCSGLSCRVYSDCASCTSDPFCGWCATQHVCAEAHGALPLFMRCGPSFLADPATCAGEQSFFQGAAEKVATVHRVVQDGKGAKQLVPSMAEEE